MNTVSELEAVMKDLAPVEIETVHSFCNGMYSRQITMPRNAVLVGAKHKTEFFMVVSKGECVIKDDEESLTLKAPCQIISRVGAKRAIFAVEETVITTFHATDETDIEKIEKIIIEPEGNKITNNGGRLLN